MAASRSFKSLYYQYLFILYEDKIILSILVLCFLSNCKIFQVNVMLNQC